MSDSRSLLHRITAFRERLEKTPHLLPAEMGGEAKANLPEIFNHASKADLLVPTLRSLASPTPNDAPLPPHITLRVRQLLQTAREMVATQRSITDDVFFVRLASNPDPDGQGPDPLVSFHRATVAATETALRLTQSFPASPEFQSRMCVGLETMLMGIRDRLTIAMQSLDRRRREWGRIERIARLLCDLQARRLVSYSSFADVAEEILAEARQGMPLRFHSAPATSVARFVAAHAVTAAQVMARIVPHDYEWASKPVVPVTLALLMDVGMLCVPAEQLARAQAWEAADWSQAESHSVAGADLLRSVMPEIGSHAEAIAAHHERQDGTGYPRGWKTEQISTLARMLAVADVYAALGADRPHRLAFDPRAALTEVLSMAEAGRLDKDFAELLVHLSVYPVGTVVELTDGRVAVVVSAHANRANLRATMRPVVAVLADARGEILPRPQVVDLASADFGGIVRALPTADRRKLFETTHPDLCN
jgi:HD-GYP domain-containing protein (c-di-GMP phosphodiesterase class II)